MPISVKQDIHSKEKGLLRVSLDGISIIFVDRKVSIGVPQANSFHQCHFVYVG